MATSKLANNLFAILGVFLEQNPDAQGGEKLMEQVTAALQAGKRKKPSKQYKTQVQALSDYLPDRKNVLFETKTLAQQFNLLQPEDINRILNGAKCLGRYRQYCPDRDSKGAITGWIFDPVGDNEIYVDAEHDFIATIAAKQQKSAQARLARLEQYFQFGRALGMKNNPKVLEKNAKTQAA